MRKTETSAVVLVVDDTPENLALLHDALDEAGYTVLVATSGESALQSVRRKRPDIILLDAIMPGIDGFQVAQHLKNDVSTQSIPVIFLTGLADTENVVNAFSHGVTDYVVKPIKPQEVLARIAAHLQRARHASQAHGALDQVDQASLTVDRGQRVILWATPQGKELFDKYFGIHPGPMLPAEFMQWLHRALQAVQEDRDIPVLMETEGSRLLGRIQVLDHENEILVLMREESEAIIVRSLQQRFNLTIKEAEVVYWMVHGKTNRQIGAILECSPRTVDKHVEHIFEKLGVETRTAAIGIVMKKVKFPSQS